MTETPNKDRTLGGFIKTFLQEAEIAFEEALATAEKKVAAAEAEVEDEIPIPNSRVNKLQIRHLKVNDHGYLKLTDLRSYLEHPGTTKQSLLELLRGRA